MSKSKVPFFIKIIIPVALLAGMETYYINSAFKDRKADYVTLDTMRQVQILHQKINHFIGSNTYYRNFDEISAISIKFTNLIESLPPIANFQSGSEKDKVLTDILKKYKSLLEHLENFKSLNGLTANSIRYSMTLHEKIKAMILTFDNDLQKEKMLRLEEQNKEIVDVLLYGRKLDLQMALQNIEGLRSLSENNILLKALLNNFEQHIKIVADGNAKIDSIRVEIDSNVIETLVNSLYLRLLKSLETKDKTNTTIMHVLQILIFLSIMLLVIIYRKELYYRSQLNLFIRRLRKKNLSQRKLLRDFDHNVIASQTDSLGRITYVSKAFCDISGYSKKELHGKTHKIVRHPTMDDNVFSQLWAEVTKGNIWHGEIKNRKKNGDFYWVEVTITPEFDNHKNIIGYSSIRHLITDRKAYEELSNNLEQRIQERTQELNTMVEKVEKLSITDELTGLYNRRFYLQTLKKEVGRAKRNKMLLFYLILDIDNFKKYNDIYGHQQGDEVLKSVADTMKNFFQRTEDTIFRMGGEEFVVIYSALTESEGFTLAQELINAVFNLQIEHKENKPFGVVTISGGAVVCNNLKGLNEELLYKKADEKLYEAKEKGRHRLQY